MQKYSLNIKIVGTSGLSGGETVTYIGRFVNRGAYTASQVAMIAAEKTANINAYDIEAFINGIFSVAKKWSAVNVWSGSFCGFRFRPQILKGFTSIDAAWGEENEWNLDAYYSADINNCLEAETPNIIGSDDEALVTVKRVGDVATETPNVIVRGDDCVITGTNLFLGRTGEGAAFECGETSYPLTLAIDTGSNQKTMVLASGPASGCSGRLVFKSYGQDRTGGALMTDVKNVSFMPKAEPTALTLDYLVGKNGKNHLNLTDTTFVNKVRRHGPTSGVDMCMLRYTKTGGTTGEVSLSTYSTETAGFITFTMAGVDPMTDRDTTKPVKFVCDMFEGDDVILDGIIVD